MGESGELNRPGSGTNQHHSTGQQSQQAETQSKIHLQHEEPAPLHLTGADTST